MFFAARVRGVHGDQSGDDQLDSCGSQGVRKHQKRKDHLVKAQVFCTNFIGKEYSVIEAHNTCDQSGDRQYERAFDHGFCIHVRHLICRFILLYACQCGKMRIVLSIGGQFRAAARVERFTERRIQQ